MVERDNVCVCVPINSLQIKSHPVTRLSLVSSPYVSQEESHEDSHISVFWNGFGIRALFQSKYIVYC